MNNKVKCNFCSSSEHDTKRTEYLYNHNGKYLLVPNTPVDVCRNCGMSYFDANVLMEIERKFFAIHEKVENPDCYIQVPTKAFE